MTRVGTIDERVTEGVQTSREYVVAGGWPVSGIFLNDDAGCEACRLEADSLGHCIPVIPSEPANALSPVRRVRCREMARRICHPDARAKYWRGNKTRVQISLANVVTKLGTHSETLGLIRARYR